MRLNVLNDDTLALPYLIEKPVPLSGNVAGSGCETRALCHGNAGLIVFKGPTMDGGLADSDS
jgi:hypothetical protein